MGNFIDFMNEEKKISRWTVLTIALAGGFCGALLTVIFMLLGFA